MVLLPLIAASLAAQTGQRIILHVDASEAPRDLIHVLELMPVKPGPFLLRYPKWIPGHHAPGGPLQNVIDFHVMAGGRELPWVRDPVELYDIHVNVPTGVDQIQVRFDDAVSPGSVTTNRLARIDWNTVLFAPKGPVAQIPVVANVKAPDGWAIYDALPLSISGNVAQLPETNLERLIDSPILMGKYSEVVPLAPGHEMDIVADEPNDLIMKPETLQGMKNLVAEAHALWGAQHYRTYHWLLSLSDHGGYAGLEHNECSEDGTGADSFKTQDGLNGLGDLVSHEYTHSWNGKYRRPADLYQPDYATPQGGTLLWVYEGMTQYWGNILPTRAGLWSQEHLKDTLANYAAQMGTKSGRTWRSTEDTAAAASIVRNAGSTWNNARRAQDYYVEGVLMWIGADATIRRLTNNKRSLDDFCKLFAGPPDTGPMIVPYKYEDVVRLLDKVAPYDWDGYLKHMIYEVHPAPTTEGLEAAGYRLVFTDQAGPQRGPGRRGRPGGANHDYDLGISLDADGLIQDMNIGSPADKSGLAPNMKVIAIGDKPYSGEVLDAAIKTAQTNSDPMVFEVVQDGVISTLRVDYHGGPKYPHLVRIEGSPDYLSEIAAPKASGR